MPPSAQRHERADRRHPGAPLYASSPGSYGACQVARMRPPDALVEQPWGSNGGRIAVGHGTIACRREANSNMTSIWSVVVPCPEDRRVLPPRIGRTDAAPVDVADVEEPPATVDGTVTDLLDIPLVRPGEHLPQWRGIATRYDKLGAVYRGGVVLRAITLWLAT